MPYVGDVSLRTALCVEHFQFAVSSPVDGASQ